MKKIYTFLAILIFLATASVASAARPAVNLHSASNITQTSATLSLSYTSDSPVAVIMFEYSPDASFGSGVVNKSGTATSTNLTGLTAGTKYYYRALVSNDDGPTTDPTSGSYNFTTLSYTAPYADTIGETNATNSSMTLNGRVNTYGTNGTYKFRYYTAGCASLLGTTSSGSLSATTGTQNVNTSISGLNAGTTYCAELIATVNGTDYSGGKVVVKTTSAAAPACTINSFTADSNSITTGNSTTLRYATSNCTTASITNIGSVNTTGSTSTGSLYSTTAFTLKANNATTSDTAALTVTVNTGGGTSSCIINSFYSDASSVYTGNSTTLRFATSNCTSATITGIGSVSTNGSISTGALSSTKSFTLTAYGSSTNDTKTISVGVLPYNGGGSSNCTISNFNADSTTLAYGASTTLRFSTNDCVSAVISSLGSVNTNGTVSTGTMYSTTSFTLTAYGAYNSSDTRTVYISVLANNGGGCTYNCGGGTVYPSCYYSATCYWNGSSWVYNNTNPNPAPTPTNPSCYYDATCYWNGSSWVYKNNNVVQNYNYNPHNPYTGGPNYVTRTVSGGVNTVYVDQPVTQVTQPNTTVYTGYDNYNYGYNSDIMSRYNANYSNADYDNRALLTGSAGNSTGVTLIGLLIALIVIALIVYAVRSNQKKELH